MVRMIPEDEETGATGNDTRLRLGNTEQDFLLSLIDLISGQEVWLAASFSPIVRPPEPNSRFIEMINLSFLFI